MSRIPRITPASRFARYALRVTLHALRPLLCLLTSAFFLSSPAATIDESKLPPASTNKVDFDRDIKPIFDHLLYREETRIPDIIAVRQAVYRQPGMQQTMNHILCLQDPEIRPRNLISEDEWRRITAPALVIGSLADKDEYLETARRVSKLMPNARYVEMHDVGHWPQFEDPETFNPISLAFLKA